MAFVSSVQIRSGVRALARSVAEPRQAPSLRSVAHVVNSDRWGGMEARTLETAAWQNAHGVHSVIVTSPGGALFEAAQRRRLPVAGIDFEGGSALMNLRRLRATLRDHGAQVADVHTNRSLAVGVRDLVTLVRSQHIVRKRKGGMALNKEFPFDGFILSSHLGKDVLTANGYARPDRVGVVGEWAEDRFFAEPASPALLRLWKRRLGLPEEGLVIGACAMLRPDNAFDELIRATARLRDKGVVVDCLMVGGPMHLEAGICPQEASLRALAAELGVADRVHFLGHRTDVPELLQVMDVVAIVSRHTAQTRIAPEAAACGRPVVGFAVGALAEAVQHGFTGWLTPAGDTTAFASALQMLLLDPQRRALAGADAARYAHQHFRESTQMESTLAIYRQAMARRAAAWKRAPAVLAPALVEQAA